MQFRFIGEHPGIWYGVELARGAVVEMPDHLEAKAQGRPDMFDPVKKPGRPKKVQHGDKH